MKLENKPTTEELLRQQLELLAERSANEASVSDLPRLTLAMVEIYKLLPLEATLPEKVTKVLSTHFTLLTQTLPEVGDDASIPFHSKEPVLNEVTGLFEAKTERS